MAKFSSEQTFSLSQIPSDGPGVLLKPAVSMVLEHVCQEMMVSNPKALVGLYNNAAASQKWMSMMR